MQTVGLLPHPNKPEALSAAEALIGILGGAGVTVRLEPEIAARLGHPEMAAAEAAFAPGLEAAVSLGGDGALLRAARRVYPWQTPLFGVNFGHLGFLAEVEAGHLRSAIFRLLANDFKLEERMMVGAGCGKPGLPPVIGLNDVVIARNGHARMVSLEIILNGVTVTGYRADGLIVATPTGSTAYSLSAGGPILHPAVSAMVLTPVCAHALHARPLVVDAHESIAVRILAPENGVSLLADGQFITELAPGDLVTFSRAEAATRLVRFGEVGFYDVLRQRFTEGKL